MWPGVDPRFTLAVSVIFGWIWGSFLNAAIDRTPHRKPLRRPTSGRPPPEPHPNLLHPPRSFCFSCGRIVAWYDNVPILSYLMLRGRCRHCGEAYGARTLAMETLTPLLFALWHEAAFALGWTPGRALWAVGMMSWLLVAALLALEARRFKAGFVRLGILLAAGLTWSLAGLF
ncbi:MAG: prepilin peptidase [bacterium]